MKNRPNILLLHTDQQRWDTIHTLGARHMITPHLDRLARRGTTFVNHYSSNPICVPARHDLITGVGARFHGYFGNSKNPIKDPGLDTIPAMLRREGYRTKAIGKMHFSPVREHYGFDHMSLMEEIPSSAEADEYLSFLIDRGYSEIRSLHGVRPVFYHSPQYDMVDEADHGTAWVADESIRFIETPRDAPFFLFASWIAPHPPLNVPERFARLYDGVELPPGTPIPASTPRHDVPSPHSVPDSLQAEIKKAYFGSITFVDLQVGRILDALERSGELDNTVVVFTSDHGEMLGDRGCFQKMTPYDGAARIPLIMSGPGFGAGVLEQAATNTSDVAATLAEIGRAAPRGNHPWAGSSLRQCPTRPDRIVYSHSGETPATRFVMAKQGRYKFIHRYNGGDEELYDLVDDPAEQNNLAESGPDELRSTLQQGCLRFEQAHGADGLVEAGHFRDIPWQPASTDPTSLYPSWSLQQYPKWMEPRSPENLAAILAEMHECAGSPHAHFARDPKLRRDAKAQWGNLGGNPSDLDVIFSELDRSR